MNDESVINATLEMVDVARMIRLLAEVGDPTVAMTIAERKRCLLTGLAEIVDADIWLWTTAVTAAVEPTSDAMATSMIDGGWKDAAEKLCVLSLLTDPSLTKTLQGGLIECLQAGRLVTIGRDRVVHPDHREEATAIWSVTGLGDALVSVYSLTLHVVSGVGFHRRAGRPAFTARERAIVHVVLEQVDWLHRQGLNIPASDRVLDLSPRQRQVLLLLLAGDGAKQIAEKMKLSEHTVGDYVKQLYRRFEVKSRGELFAHFISGGSVA